MSEEATAPAQDNTPRVVWDDSRMTASFANVVNIQSTQEQVDLFFGTNTTWTGSATQDVKVELTNRITMSPVAAKRMWLALGGVIEEYEGRYGEMKVAGP